ncbi:Cytosol aminopeptidase [Buchnera aphidicola (Eriosoma grossulariae)]|uniref:leucyl aminopeptidase n=1 Tax=Buchnera aphidicola TaxID=9 RepID=UPI003463FEDF
MHYSITHSLKENSNIDCLVLFLFSSISFSSSVKDIDDFNSNYISHLIANKDFNQDIGNNLLLHNINYFNIKKILLIGCGKINDLKIYSYKKIIQNSIQILLKNNIKNVIYIIQDLNLNNRDIYWKIRLAIEYIENQLYLFNKFKSKIVRNDFVLSEIIFHILLKKDLPYVQLAIKHASSIVLGIKETKDISNTPPNICNPLFLVEKAKYLSELYKENIYIDIIDEVKMKQLGMHAYLAVSQGSKNQSYMTVIKYHGNNYNNNYQDIVFIGKGVTFDSGGLSIKPALNMHYMKYDMCGAAAIYGVLLIVAKLKLPINIIGVMATCENMPGGNSLRPGDILQTMSNKTVEVLNTDAEGRLILCDVLTYVERFNPKIVIDVATLTGACVVALGTHITGLMSNSNSLSKSLIIAGKQTNDIVWRLPIIDEYQKDLNSYVADMTNIGHNSAGAIVASCFLSQFAHKYKWAHLDIAGTAWLSGNGKGATGRPVSLLVQFILNMLNN